MAAPPCFTLHAQRSLRLALHFQRARFRSVESLQSGVRAVVVATDVAARGLDIPNVASVVHYDVARKVDGFVHRAGRTAVSASLSYCAGDDATMKKRRYSD
jgi:superfamily II DNA/RNA helicase